MRNKNLLASLALLTGSSLAGGSFAASLPGDVVYQRTDSFSLSVSLSDSFTVSSPGLYKVTLTDLKNSKPFLTSMLDVKTNNNSLGSITGPGSFSFETVSGFHDINFAATVVQPDIAEEEKERLVDEARKTAKTKRAIRWQSLTDEQKARQIERRANRTKEQREEQRAKVLRRYELMADEQLANMYTGEYDIQITHSEGFEETAVVPVPAAAWLFGSGLLALAGAARRKKMR